MKTVTGVLCLLLVSSVGCGQQNVPTPGAPTPAEQAVPEAPPAAASAPVPASSTAGAAATAAVTPADAVPAGEEVTAGEEKTAADKANILLAEAVAPVTPAAASRWKEGTHYQRLVPVQPSDSAPDKIEVIEIFWYGCAHCYSLDPYIENWVAKKPAYVDFKRVPVAWGAVHRLHARLYYTIEALGKHELHAAAFREIQVAGNMLVAKDGNAAETGRLQSEFAKRHGVDAETFAKTYRSFDVETKMKRAEELTRRYRVEGVPMMVVNGKYTADVQSAGGQSQIISLVSDLAAGEHQKK